VPYVYIIRKRSSPFKLLLDSKFYEIPRLVSEFFEEKTAIKKRKKASSTIFKRIFLFLV